MITHSYLEPQEICQAHLQEMMAAGVVFANKKILDLGCGTGMYAIKMVELGATHVVGVDSVPQNIAVAQALNPYEKFEKVAFWCQDIRQSWTKETFDLVLMRGVIYYLDTDWLELLKTIYQELNDNGVLLVSFLNKNRRSMTLNVFKRFLSKFPEIVKPVIRTGLALGIYLIYRCVSAGQPLTWETVKNKTNTLFFPAQALTSPAQAVELLQKSGFSVRAVFTGQGQFKKTTDDYMVWAIKK